MVCHFSNRLDSSGTVMKMITFEPMIGTSPATVPAIDMKKPSFPQSRCSAAHSSSFAAKGYRHCRSDRIKWPTLRCGAAYILCCIGVLSDVEAYNLWCIGVLSDAVPHSSLVRLVPAPGGR